MPMLFPVSWVLGSAAGAPLEGRKVWRPGRGLSPQLPAVSPLLLLCAPAPPPLVSGSPYGTVLFPALQMPMEIFRCITVRSREQRLSLQMASPLLLQALRFDVLKTKTRSCHPAACASKALPQKNCEQSLGEISAALGMRAKTWKQPTCPSRGDGHAYRGALSTGKSGGWWAHPRMSK